MSVEHAVVSLMVLLVPLEVDIRDAKDVEDTT